MTEKVPGLVLPSTAVDLTEADVWPDGIYQLETSDPVLGGPDGIDNAQARQLAARSRYQRLRNVTPWDDALSYPAGAYVAHAGTTWLSVAASVDIEPGSDARKWARWAFTEDELKGELGDAVAAHEAKDNPHPQYAGLAAPGEAIALHERKPDPHPQYARVEAMAVMVASHEGEQDPHAQYAFREGRGSVPENYIGACVVVLLPHVRQMVWDGSRYVRAPWHQPGMVQYSYDNPASISGYLPVRGDVVYNQANYPDLVKRLGLSGSGTFSLIDLRGEFIRCLDNGRGVDASRSPLTWQDGDNRHHAHGVYDPGHAHGVGDPGHAHSAWTDGQGHHDHANGIARAAGPYGLAAANQYGGAYAGNVAQIAMDGAFRTDGNGNHAHNVGVAGAGTGIWIGASGTGIGIYGEGSEARPRNVALPAWISY